MRQKTNFEQRLEALESIVAAQGGEIISLKNQIALLLVSLDQEKEYDYISVTLPYIWAQVGRPDPVRFPFYMRGA